MGEIVTLVRGQLARAFAGLAIQAWHGRDRIERVPERHRVMSIGPCYHDNQRDATRVYDEVSLAAKLSPIRRG